MLPQCFFTARRWIAKLPVGCYKPTKKQHNQCVDGLECCNAAASAQLSCNHHILHTITPPPALSVLKVAATITRRMHHSVNCCMDCRTTCCAPAGRRSAVGAINNQHPAQNAWWPTSNRHWLWCANQKLTHSHTHATAGCSYAYRTVCLAVQSRVRGCAAYGMGTVMKSYAAHVCTCVPP
jgi:hypothetical protein